MEQVMNENNIYRAAIYCRLSKDDEQTGESVSIETQKMLLTDYCVERGGFWTETKCKNRNNYKEKLRWVFSTTKPRLAYIICRAAIMILRLGGF